MSVYKYAQLVAFNGAETGKVVDVSQYVGDATQGLWTLYDLTGAEIVGAAAPTSATSVTLTVNPAPSAGAYQLVGIQ